MKKITFLILSFVALISAQQASACTRIVYTGKDKMVVTGRTMDWKGDMQSNIWIFPRGMERNGMVGQNSLTWVSKYGSVVTSVYEIASTDGLNEKGLVANLLWLSESQYPVRDKDKPGMAISAWVQYVLDNFASVNEAVDFIEKNPFQILSDNMPDGSGMAALHLSVSDALGDNAIFEYVDGKLVIYHSKEYNVMANSPFYDKQLARFDEWKSLGALVSLQGEKDGADRFSRASFFTEILPKTDDPKIAVTGVFGAIDNTYVPYRKSIDDAPDQSKTIWRTASDSKNKTYFFESFLNPCSFWVNLNEVDLSVGAPVLKLSLINGETYKDNATKDFEPAQAFEFLGIM